jgi:tetratricopeptide (TPR) repeat protein
MNFDSGKNEDFLTLKMQGNTYMQDKQYLKAVQRYSGALYKLPPIENSNQEEIKNRLITLSNRAEGFLKLGYFYSSLKDCEEILEKNKQHLSLLDTTQKDKVFTEKEEVRSNWLLLWKILKK